MRCPDCEAKGRLYCFLDEEREVPRIVLKGLPRIEYIPRVVA